MLPCKVLSDILCYTTDIKCQLEICLDMRLRRSRRPQYSLSGNNRHFQEPGWTPSGLTDATGVRKPHQLLCFHDAYRKARTPRVRALHSINFCYAGNPLRGLPGYHVVRQYG